MVTTISTRRKIELLLLLCLTRCVSMCGCRAQSLNSLFVFNCFILFYCVIALFMDIHFTVCRLFSRHLNRFASHFLLKLSFTMLWFCFAAIATIKQLITAKEYYTNIMVVKPFRPIHAKYCHEIPVGIHYASMFAASRAQSVLRQPAHTAYTSVAHQLLIFKCLSCWTVDAESHTMFFKKSDLPVFVFHLKCATIDCEFVSFTKTANGTR